MHFGKAVFIELGCVMDKILIIGGSGAGKTTVSLRLAEITGLPVTHIDKAYFRPGWVRRDNKEVKLELEAVANSKRWILDGTDFKTIDTRINHADCIVFLHVPTVVRTYRVFVRLFKRYGKTSVDFPTGCKGRMRFRQVRWAFWGYNYHVRWKLNKLLARYGSELNIRHIYSKTELSRLYDSLS